MSGGAALSTHAGVSQVPLYFRRLDFVPCRRFSVLETDIAMHEEGIKKLYYSIGEVSEMTDLEQHVLRYWESEFEQLKPRKNRAGRRVYTEEDIEMVQQVQHLLKEDKYTIEGAKQVLDREMGPGTRREYRRDLTELRSFLEDLLVRIEGD